MNWPEVSAGSMGVAINPNQEPGVRVSRTNPSLCAGIYAVDFAVRPEKLPLTRLNESMPQFVNFFVVRKDFLGTFFGTVFQKSGALW
jgi:hypothetical protein